MSSSRTSLALLALLVACGSDPPPESPSSKKTTDTTEVKMEAVPVASTAPAPSPVASASAAEPTAAAPTGDPSDDPNIGGPQDATVEAAVAPIRPRLRACYKKALAADPKAAGSATFDTTIAKDGKVSAARFVKKEALSDDFVSCLTSAVKAMSFSPDRKSQVVAFTFGTSAGAPKAPPPVTAPVASYGGADAGPLKH